MAAKHEYILTFMGDFEFTNESCLRIQRHRPLVKTKTIIRINMFKKLCDDDT